MGFSPFKQEHPQYGFSQNLKAVTHQNFNPLRFKIKPMDGFVF